jgi:hypothetical protein
VYFILKNFFSQLRGALDRLIPSLWGILLRFLNRARQINPFLRSQMQIKEETDEMDGDEPV